VRNFANKRNAKLHDEKRCNKPTPWKEVHHRPPSVGVNHGLRALVFFWCRGDVTNGASSAGVGIYVSVIYVVESGLCSESL